MQYENLGRRPQIQLLIRPLVLLALAAVPHLRLAELLLLREFPETVFKFYIPVAVL